MRSGAEFEPVALPHGRDWIMRPAIEGLCKFESLKDGSLDLCDVALMNEALDVRDENMARAQEAARAK